MTSALSAPCSTGSASTGTAGAPRAGPSSPPGRPPPPRPRNPEKQKGRSARNRPSKFTGQKPDEDLLDLLVQRVALEEGIVFLLLDALGHGLLVALGEIARSGFALFAGFSALQCNGFLHGLNGLEGRKKGS